MSCRGKSYFLNLILKTECLMNAFPAILAWYTFGYVLFDHTSFDCKKYVHYFKFYHLGCQCQLLFSLPCIQFKANQNKQQCSSPILDRFKVNHVGQHMLMLLRHTCSPFYISLLHSTDKIAFLLINIIHKSQFSKRKENNERNLNIKEEVQQL